MMFTEQLSFQGKLRQMIMLNKAHYDESVANEGGVYLEDLCRCCCNVFYFCRWICCRYTTSEEWLKYMENVAFEYFEQIKKQS